MSKTVKQTNVRRWILPASILGVVWFFLTGGAALSWLIGIPAVILGIAATRSLPAMASFSIDPIAVIPFIFFFLKQSLLGGVDVALRALLPGCRLAPRLITYPFRMKNEIARLYFANVVSLLPGTLSADLQGDGILIHLLDEALPNQKNLKKLEEKIAWLFGERNIHG